MEYNGIKKLFALYQEDVHKAKAVTLAQSYFYFLWRQLMNKGVVDPATSIKYCTHVRINHCRGFAKCTTCEILSCDIARATDEDERASFARALAEHHEEVCAVILLHRRHT